MGSAPTYLSYPDLPTEDGTGVAYSTSYHVVDRYRFGIQFEFRGDGKIGHWDWNAVWVFAVDAVVTLAIVPAIISRIAMYMFGFQSRIYWRQLYQEPDGTIKDMSYFIRVWEHLFKKERVNRFTWLNFCSERGIEVREAKKMWDEVLWNPYLKRKGYLSATMVWSALEEMEDVSRLIHARWHEWQEEYLHELAAQRLTERSIDLHHLASADRTKLLERTRSTDLRQQSTQSTDKRLEKLENEVKELRRIIKEEEEPLGLAGISGIFNQFDTNT